MHSGFNLTPRRLVETSRQPGENLDQNLLRVVHDHVCHHAAVALERRTEPFGNSRTHHPQRPFASAPQRFIKDYQVGVEKGIPVCELRRPGSDVYLEASMWMWRPVLKLKKGSTYVLHLSSFDINHGFSLYPMNINFQVVPGYDYGLRVTPNNGWRSAHYLQ
jgi:hypothetical protein